MATTYELWLKTATGTPLAILDRFLSFDYQRTVNQVGKVILTVPWGAYPMSYFQDDAILEVWRAVDNGLPYLEGGTVFFLHVISKQQSAAGEKLLTLTFFDAATILDRRIINYTSDDPQSSHTGLSDDICKTFVLENAGSLAADGTRDLSAWLTVAAPRSLGVTTTKTASHRPLLATLQEIATDSFTKGAYLAFDVVSLIPATGVALQFQTFTGVRGVDHRASAGTPVILSPDNANLTELDRTRDAALLRNAIYAGGQGKGAIQPLRQSLDNTSIGESPWARHEEWLNASNSADPVAVQAEADNELRAKRLRYTLAARFVDTPALRYGRDFGYGDFVTCQWDDDTFDMRVASVGIKVAEHQEALDIALRSDGL